MRVRAYSACALAVLLAAAVGGAAPAAGASTPAVSRVASPAVRTVGLPSSGKHVTLAPKQRLRIALRTAVDGGYRWAVTTHPAASTVRIVSTHLTAYPHRPGTVGFPYHTDYLLQAVAPGTTTIRLVEREPGGRSDIAGRYSLTLRVSRPAAPKTSSHACTRTSSGSCIRGGEFCPSADFGNSGWDAQGRRYVCSGDPTHPHWETP